MPRKVLVENSVKEAVPTHYVDASGKNHYGIKYVDRYRLDYHVKNLRAEHRRSTADQRGNEEYLHFKLELYEEYDLGLIVPINIVGPFFRHMIELGSNFKFERGLIVPTS